MSGDKFDQFDESKPGKSGRAVLFLALAGLLILGIVALLVWQSAQPSGALQDNSRPDVVTNSTQLASSGNDTSKGQQSGQEDPGLLAHDPAASRRWFTPYYRASAN